MQWADGQDAHHWFDGRQLVLVGNGPELTVKNEHRSIQTHSHKPIQSGSKLHNRHMHHGKRKVLQNHWTSKSRSTSPLTVPTNPVFVDTFAHLEILPESKAQIGQPSKFERWSLSPQESAGKR
jgi:hypothetical protein